jgi:O-antigen biosynthesis protein
MSINPLVEISVAVRNNWTITEKFLHSYFETALTYDNTALNIIDNASTDNTVIELEKYQDKAQIFSNDTNKGFAFAHNMVLRKSFAPYTCILHNDIKFYPGWLNALVSYMEDNPKIGILGVTNDVYGTFSIGGELEDNGNYKFIFLDNEEQKDCKLDFVHSSCMFIKNRVLKTVGYLDEKFVYGGKSDIDLCIRAQDAGFQLNVLKDVIIDHNCGPTARLVGLDNYAEQNRVLLLKKNEEWFKNNKGSAQFRIKKNKKIG